LAGLRIIAESAGARLSARNADRSTEIAMVSANCWYTRPVRPPSSATGTNTAERMSAIAITGPDTSFMAWTVASLGVFPCSI
jgi:hypothetical protein